MQHLCADEEARKSALLRDVSETLQATTDAGTFIEEIAEKWGVKQSAIYCILWGVMLARLGYGEEDVMKMSWEAGMEFMEKIAKQKPSAETAAKGS